MNKFRCYTLLFLYFLLSVVESYLQVGTSLCASNCTLDHNNTPDCFKSQDRCCSVDYLSCSSYFTCIDGDIYKAVCPPFQSYDSSRCSKYYECYIKCSKLCNDSTNVMCGESDECCSPLENNCKYFISCSSNRTTLEQCPEGSIFDESTLACIQGRGCFMREPEPCHKLCRGPMCQDNCCGSYSRCSSDYYVCESGKKFARSCLPFEMFNVKTLECDDDTFRICSGETYYTSTTVQVSFHSTEMLARRLLSKEEFLSAIYSVYTQVGEKLSVEINRA